MQYESGTEKVATICGNLTPTVKPLSPSDDSQIKRTRKILMIILGICFVSLYWICELLLGNNEKQLMKHHF